MTHTYYTSLSGMLAASFGLRNASNNIANMQTGGFKRSDVSYQSFGNPLKHGGGVYVGNSSINFKSGEFTQGNNPTDLAISGNGFFIVKMKNGELLYTRNGEFIFNEQGVLIDKQSQGEVQGYDRNGNLIPIREKGPEFHRGKVTEQLWLNGKFVAIEKTEQEKKDDVLPLKNNYRNIEFTIDKIYDAEGKPHTLKLVFESTRVPPTIDPTTGQIISINDDGTSWDLLEVICDDTKVAFNPQKLQFSNGGFLRTKESSIRCTLKGEQSITLELGDYSFSADKAVQLKHAKTSPEDIQTGSVIKTWQQDGYAQGKQIRFAMDDNGQITYFYDNGQSLYGDYIALSRFDNMASSLSKASGHLFRSNHTRGMHFNRPNQAGFGSIQMNKIESSNVDSTTEFAHIVVLQRMFQSCSQIMNIDRELLEGLYKK